jgi:hypothetical protein
MATVGRAGNCGAVRRVERWRVVVMRRLGTSLLLLAVWTGPIACPAMAESGGHGKSGHGAEKTEKKPSKTPEDVHGAKRSATTEDDRAACAASREARGDRLPATEFVTLSAFTVPLMVNGRVNEQFTLVVALELADEDVRHEVVGLTPILRNEIYDLLFKSVTFRKGEPRIPRTADLRAQLFRVVRKVTIAEQVKSVVVQQAVRGNLP